MSKYQILKTSLIFSLALLFSCQASKEGRKEASPQPAESPAQVQAKPDQVQGQADTNLAPDFTLTSINGDQVSLSNFKGKVLIIDFWATWCPPCVKGVPEFSELYRTYKDKGFEIVGISVDREGPTVVKNFIEKNKVPYTVVMANMAVVDAYQVYTGIPTTFIVDREGRIADKVIGYQPKSYFEDQLKKLL
jgi:peroxiredoxin